MQPYQQCKKLKVIPINTINEIKEKDTYLLKKSSKYDSKVGYSLNKHTLIH